MGETGRGGGKKGSKKVKFLLILRQLHNVIAIQIGCAFVFFQPYILLLSENHEENSFRAVFSRRHSFPDPYNEWLLLCLYSNTNLAFWSLFSLPAGHASLLF